jgi:hypothetical protein
MFVESYPSAEAVTSAVPAVTAETRTGAELVVPAGIDVPSGTIVIEPSPEVRLTSVSAGAAKLEPTFTEAAVPA